MNSSQQPAKNMHIRPDDVCYMQNVKLARDYFYTLQTPHQKGWSGANTKIALRTRSKGGGGRLWNVLFMT